MDYYSYTVNGYSETETMKEWKDGQQVNGVYFDQEYTGKIDSTESRHTPDYKNFQFVIDLDAPVTVYGVVRERITVVTNNSNNTIAAA